MKIKILLLVFITFFTGCSFLLPKRVEFFQDKVHAAPTLKSSDKELQKEAAALAEELSQRLLVAAVSNDCPADVVDPARDVSSLTKSVSTSLGPPLYAYVGEPTNLAFSLEKSTAKFNKRVESFNQENNKNAGKKIEGTGIFKVGYFTAWGIAIGFVALLWFGFKVWGMFNPVVGLGTNIVGRVSSSVLHQGFTQLTKAGEDFKDYVASSNLTAEAKQTVLDLFQRSHRQNQDQSVQAVVKDLTK